MEMTVEQRRAYHRAHYAKNKAAMKVAAAEKQQNLKRKVMEGYGGKCSQCGETELEFLTLDHVNNDGASHRVGKNNLYLWAIKNNFPDCLQCLCFTCNLTKSVLIRPKGVSNSSKTLRKYREQIIEHYGSKCSCCGNSNLAALAIDHVYGGGCKHRKQGLAIVTQIVRSGFPNSYRLLCHNCNHSARMGGGVCLHKRKALVTRADYYKSIGILNKFSGEVDISKEVLEGYREKMSNREIGKLLADAISECEIKPPYRISTFEEAMSDFKALQALECFPEKQQRTGLISSNHFQEMNMWGCVTEEGISAHEAWYDKKSLLTICCGIALADGHGITRTNLRRYANLFIGLPSQFRPAVAKGMYERYANGGRVLDCCSGWGDRLSGFWASSASEYVGIDPNSNLFEAYDNQIKAYSAVVPKKATLLNRCAEDVKPSEIGFFDFGFTSPPYWTAERYSRHEGQSSIRYKTYDEWLGGFLEPMMRLQAEVCRKFCININDAEGMPIVRDTLEIAKRNGWVLLETLRYALPVRPGKNSLVRRTEPMMVFRGNA